MVNVKDIPFSTLRCRSPQLKGRRLGIRAAVREDQRLLQMRMIINEIVVRLLRTF
ncbi:hypothetical protein D3C76_708220 [compost metagenome]